MNERIRHTTEQMTRGYNAEHHRDKKAAQKEHKRMDEATIITHKLSLKEKSQQKRAKRRER